MLYFGASELLTLYCGALAAVAARRHGRPAFSKRNGGFFDERDGLLGRQTIMSRLAVALCRHQSFTVSFVMPSFRLA
jgi:hypothetical protein